jgi:hypothetical protein
MVSEMIRKRRFQGGVLEERGAEGMERERRGGGNK